MTTSDKLRDGTTKCLVIVDDTRRGPPFTMPALAIRVGGGVVMLRIIEIEDQNSNGWVADIMRRRSEDAANEALDRPPAAPTALPAITPERVIREGNPTEQILDVIDKTSISHAGAGGQPGRRRPRPADHPIAQATGSFPIPVMIVSGDLKDAEIDALS